MDLPVELEISRRGPINIKNKDQLMNLLKQFLRSINIAKSNEETL